MKKLAFLAAALALAACNSGTTVTTKDGQKVTISGDGKGDDVTFSAKTDEGEFRIQSGKGAGDVVLPKGFAFYPGAEVRSRSTMKTDRGSNLTVAMATPDPADKVIAYYRDQATSAGVDVTNEIKTGELQMISGKDKAGMVFSLSVFPDQKGGNTATLSLVQELQH